MDHAGHSFSSYMPHGHCYLWEPALVGTHVISDLLIGLAYVSISISLYLLVRKIRLPFSPIVLAFGVFIGACGLTHFMEIWNLWNADYWAGGWVKVVTATASVATGLALVRLSPKIVAFAEAAKLSEQRGVQLEQAYSEMEERVRERTIELERAHARELEIRHQVEALYAAAQRANRLKDEFLATMSHELRTPVSVILGYTEMLENGDISGDQAKQAVTTVRRNALVQSQLVNDLLDVSMIVSGKMKLDSKVIDIREPVEHAVETVRLAAQAKAITLQVDIDRANIPVFGDATRIQQIVWNLISNAIKFTEKEGSVAVTVRRDGGTAEIVVKDSGYGIDPQFLPHVFERFRQEDSSSSRKHGGLGLGLGIVRHLVELHGGTVEAESEGRGKGATFKVKVPIAPIEELKVAAPEKEEFKVERLRGIKVLVIDDERDVRELLASSLTAKGLLIEQAASAVEALSKITTFQPHVLLCDIGMPDTDGYALIRLVRDQELKFGGFIPAIALTAYAQEGVKQKVLAAGFQAYLVKPASSEQLLEQIAQQLS